VAVFDYGALPPEINSGRMYAGAGSGPLLAAAAAWDGLASELSLAASSYQSTVLELTGGVWLGPASAAMAAAAAPYVTWMAATAAQAEQAASQAWLAAAAYEAAFTGTVPPPVIVANRALLMSLVATNIVGQNTAAIAATEAQYAQMWAQDAAVMYGYAGASAAATTLTPFTSPPQTTNPAGTGTQAAARATAAATSTGTAQNALSQVPNTLQSLASGGASQTILNVFNSPVGTASKSLVSALTSVVVGPQTSATFLAIVPTLLTAPVFTIPAMSAGAAGATIDASAVSPAAAGLGTLAGSYGSRVGGAGVSAGLGQAASVGGLSVPQSWATASPAIRLAATALPVAGLDGVPQAGPAGLGGFGGMPMMGGVVNASRYGAAGHPSESRLKVIPQIAAAPVHESTPARGMTPNGGAADAVDALSDRERYELHELRKEIAEVAMQRDAVDRLIKEAMRR
jgi:PPE-repeat protein